MTLFYVFNNLSQEDLLIERNGMRKFGFKIFSTNLQTAPTLIKECAEFASNTQDMFIELMVVANTTKEDLNNLKQQLGNIEVRIHAPHNTMGFDAGNKDLEQQNRKILAVSQNAADIFDAKTIVVHAGCGHGQQYIDETARQFKLFNDKRIVVENLPFYANNDEPLHGNTADEIAYIMNESGCGFCFDFSHAICAAVALNLNTKKHLQSFYALKPTVYHMCDGDINKAEDSHMHFSTGNYPLEQYLNDYTDKNAYITMETGKGIMQHNDLWVKDYQYLKSIQNR